MIYSAIHVTSRDLNLGSNFDIDLFTSICIYFDPSRGKEHYGTRIMSLTFIVQKLFAKNTKKRYFKFMTSIALIVEVRPTLIVF